MNILSKVGAFLFVTLVMVSCNRDYNCTCSYDYTYAAEDDTQKSITIPGTSKKSAEKKCNLNDREDKGTGVVVDCELNP